MSARISLRNNLLALESPYDPALVYALKQAVPASDRQWDKGARVWLVSPQFGQQLQKVCQQFGYSVTLPMVQTVKAVPVMRVFKLEYLGGCKDRDDGTLSAFGFCEGSWSVVITEQVLKSWFEGSSQTENHAASTEKPTFYRLLGVASTAGYDEIKKAYRRLARQWHTDVCSEPNAKEMFLSIKAAYDLLSEPIKRKRYDAGLLFEQRASQEANPVRRIVMPDLFRSPLRCGMVLAEAVPGLKWSIIKILAWDDVTRDDGQVLVSSWDSANNCIRYEWTLP